MLEMHHSSSPVVLKTPVPNADGNSSPVIIRSSISRDLFSCDNVHNETANDSTPRAKFLKAAADDRHAMQSCTIEDLARLLHDADSAATNEHVLKLAITFANNDVRERLQRAEKSADEAQAIATQTKYDADCQLLDMQLKHKLIIDALILAQKEAMSLAMEDEDALRLHVLQLEKCIREHNQSQALLITRNEDLELSIQESALKLVRLDAVEFRATSLENALGEAWDRVRHVEASLKSQNTEFEKVSAQLFEVQTHARSLESSLNVAEATITANCDVALKEKKNFENIVTQLRLDLNLSRDAVCRARGQTDAMIEQLARVHTEKSSLVEAHAESMRNILTRSLELEALMDMQAADYLSLQNQLIESDGAASSAELRTCVSEQALQALKCEYDEAQGASRREIAKISEAFDELKQECADLKESSQSQFSAALKKDAEFTVTLKGLQLDLQNSFQNNSVNSLRASQLEEEVKDLVMKNNLLRSALEQCRSKLSEAEKEKALFLTAHTKTHQSNEVKMISSISGENMEGPSELAQPLDEIISGVSSPARAMDSANASVQSSLSNSPRIAHENGFLPLSSKSIFSSELENMVSPAHEHEDEFKSSEMKCCSPSGSQIDEHRIEAALPDAASAVDAAFPTETSTSSSPAIPLTSPPSSPGNILPLHTDMELTACSTSNFDATSFTKISTPAAMSSEELSNSLRKHLSESRWLSPSSPLFSPHSSNLTQLYSQSSPRPEPDSHEGTMCASSDPSYSQEILSECIRAGQEVQLQKNALKAETEIPPDDKSKLSMLQGSAISANGSKVTWVYHGTLNVHKMPEGKGTRTFSNGEVYDGMWHEGLRHGNGRTVHADGAVYIGEYQSGQKNGKGTCTYPNGSVHDGNYEGGVKSGFGTCSWPNGNVFSGMYANDRMHGPGTFQWASGHVYMGEFAMDRRHGCGTLISDNGRRREGQWNNGTFVAETH